MMNPLSLSPLPTLRSDDESDRHLMEREGFVDEAVVAALVKGNPPSRSAACPDDLALAADDFDFAGWRLSKAETVRSPEVPPQVIDAIVRRAAPPVVGRSRPESEPQAKYRWWFVGSAGVIASLLFSILLLTLSARPGSHFEMLLSPRMLTTTKPVSAQQTEPAKLTTELTEVSPIGR
jgi:hypothetical protein